MADDGDQGETKSVADARLGLSQTAASPVANLTDPEPTQIAHFKITGRLGAGGMGFVYTAEDEALRRTVAVKVLVKGAGNEETKQRFLREARSAAAISHPNVAVVHQVGEADGRVYIAMELVQGENLRARIQRGPIDLPDVRSIALQIARALSAAHEKGIVHRDLKPENVMITKDGFVKLLDFGLAKPGAPVLESDAGLAKTETLVTSDQGRIMGTPAYMSPEQAMGHAVDVRSDVFSFGVLLFEMLAGERPFRGPSANAVLVAIARDAAPRVPNADATLAAIVARCLEKDPAARFANGSELVAVLTDRLSASDTKAVAADARSISPSETVRPRRRRSLGVAVSLVLATAFAAGASSLPRRGASPAVVALPSALAPARPGPIGLLDHPPPVTKSPEALAAYQRGLTDLRDGIRAPQAAFAKAVQLDPEFAAAQLRLAMAKFSPGISAEYGEALRFRNLLDARDAEILAAEEPLGAVASPNYVEAERRYAALHESRPLDVEILLRLAEIRLRKDARTARATARELIALAPHTAGAELVAGDIYRDADDFDAATSHYRRCVELSPMAARCLARLTRIRAASGECEQYAEGVTRVLTIQPDDWFYRLDGLSAALTSGARPDDVRAAIDAFSRVSSDPLSGFEAARLDGEWSLYRGALTAAQQSFLLAERAARDAGVSVALPATVRERLLIAEELGDERAARELVRAYVGARALAIPDTDSDSVVLTALKRYRVFGDDELLRIRDRWRRDLAGLSPPLAWLRYEGALAVTEREARDALSSGFEKELGHDRLDVNAQLGRLLLTARRYEEAAARLERVAPNCALFRDDDSYVPLVTVAALELGQAREGLADVAGACVAYHRVLARWGAASPRSKTAEAARQRARALRCPG